MKCCTGNCNQGDCLHSVNASRAIFRMRPLSEEEADKPILSREQVMGAIWYGLGVGIFGALALVVVLFAPRF